MFACLYFKISVFTLSGSDLDFQDEDGNTALHHVSVSQEYHMDQRTTPMLLHVSGTVNVFSTSL